MAHSRAQIHRGECIVVACLSSQAESLGVPWMVRVALLAFYYAVTEWPF